MTVKPSAVRALEAADRCIRACVDSANAELDVFKSAWNASQEALNNESLTYGTRLFIERIVLFVLISMTDYRKIAREEARAEVRRAQDAAREEVRRAQDAARDEVQRAQDAAREEIARTQDAAREEIKRAVEAAIDERKELERRVVALCLCVAVGVGLFFTRWQVYALFPLASALCVLKFRLPIKSLAGLSPFKIFGKSK